MHQRGRDSAAKRMTSDDVERKADLSPKDHLDGADQGKAYVSTDKDGPVMSHLVSMILLSTMLLCTILFLRYDNHQIGIAARAIGDMEKIIKDMEARITSLQENPKCKKTSEDLKNKLTDLEKKLKDQTDQTRKIEDQSKALGTQKVDLESQITKLTKEKHILSKRLGMKMAGSGGEGSGETTN